jgi:hypothetical protein
MELTENSRMGSFMTEDRLGFIIKGFKSINVLNYFPSTNSLTLQATIPL